MLKFYFCFVFMLFIPKLFWLYLESLILSLIIFSILILPNSYIYNSLMQKIDLMSYSLILITLFIFILMILSSTILNMKNNNKTSFLIVLLFLMFILVGCFGILDFLMFYILFEMSLIPTLLLILGWGYQPERILAGMYMLMYTLIASFPLLLLIFFCQVNKMSLMMNFMFWFNSPWWVQVILILAFLVKMPMFLVHLWLPKAHVEAPIAGSMILAGVLLKLGGYGLLRILPMIFQMKLNLLLLLSICNLFGSMMISVKCLSQTDFKSLIAYSSVVHMGFILFCVFNYNVWGWEGSLLMMVAHGICSSGLFTLANVVYERYSSRSMMILKGMINLMPSMSLWWFLLLSSNMSAPPTLNLMSEISLLISVMNWSNLSMVILLMTCFFSAGYCLYLFSFSQHGLLTSSFFCQVNNNMREYFLMFLHWIPINIMILKSEVLFSWI